MKDGLDELSASAVVVVVGVVRDLDRVKADPANC